MQPKKDINREREKKMRELFRQRISKKGKRIVAGIIAAILAIMMAIPMKFPAMEVKAGETVNSIEIVGGKLERLDYTIVENKEGTSGEYKYKDKEKIFTSGEQKWDFAGEKVIKVTAKITMNDGYFIESVKEDGTVLNSEQYTFKEDGTITYDTKDDSSIGNIKIICIPKELKVSELKVAREQDSSGVYNNNVVLSWKNPQIPSGSEYALNDYRLIIQKEVNGNKTTIYNGSYLDKCNETNGTFVDCEAGAHSTNATYTVSVVANKACEQDNTFTGVGSSIDWKAHYDVELVVNGDGKVKIADTEYANSVEPYILYNILEAENNETNLNMTITPGENQGVKSLLVNGTEEKLEIENNTYNMLVKQNGRVEITFAELTAAPSITTSGDKYTQIADNGEVQVTSAENVDETRYGYEALGTPQEQPRWKNVENDFSKKFDGASQTDKISANDLFGTENYAILRAFSGKEGKADSNVAEQYYVRTPEMPATTGVSLDGYTLGQWTASDVTLNYKNTSARKYAGLELGYLDDQGNITWKEMGKTDNNYGFTLSDTKEYKVYLRFKIEDPNNREPFIYGEPFELTDNVKIDKEQPGLTVSGYTSGTWVNEDVTLTLENNNVQQISGTNYQYAVYKDLVDVTSDTLDWQDCTSGNEVNISCEDGKVLIEYVYMKAVSGAGVESQVCVCEVKIDKENPDTPEVVADPIDGDNGWYMTLPEIRVEEVAKDTGSEIFTYYKMYDIHQPESSIVEMNLGENGQPEITQDGSYILEYYAKDEAGNISEIGKLQLDVDTGAPNSPSIEFRTENDSVLAHIINFITFGYFCNERVVAVIESTDSLSQVKEYGVWYTQDGEEGEVSILEGTTVEVELPENFKGTVSAYAVDYAGNQSGVSVSDGIVYESTQAEITITTDVDNSKWQNKDVSFHVITQDKQSGLQKVEYILNGKTVYENDFTDGSHNDVVYMDQQAIQATEEAVTSAGYTLLVKVTDNAGNKSEKSAVVYLDKTAPVIGFSGVENGAYSNNTETLNVKVDEQIYDLNHVTVSATRTIDGVTTPYDMEGFVSDSVNAKKSYAFSEDGNYVVTVNAVDAAGNTAAPKQISFTIDKTAPKIELTGPQNDSYHASDVPVEVKVEESFFDTDTVSISVTKTLDGQTGNVDFGNWSNQGKNSTLSRNFSEDGTYQIEVQAKDAAGNEAVAQQLTFTVDKTAPEVNINGAADYLITGNNITLSYDVVESYFDTDNVTIQMQKEDAAGNVTDVNVGSWVNSGKESTLTYVVKEEGIYTSVITAVDKAGNESTARKTVTVDTSDPIIKHVDEMNGKYYQVFKLPYELSEMVRDLTVPNVSMYLNSDEYDGVSEITDEGKYVFKMDVSDEVGHKAVAQAEFIVDNTEPKIIFSGIEDGAKYDKEVEWSISLKDAKDVMKEITVDGEKQEFDTEKNICQGTLKSKGTHTVQVKAEDLAGNITEKSINVTITEGTVLETWSDNKPLVVGGIVAVAGVTGVGAAYATGIVGKGAGKGLFKKKGMKK